jgi:hypothetical protein
MGRFRRAIQDLRHRRYLDAYVGWILALLVVLLQIVASFVSDRDKLDTVVMATIILLLGIVALATADIRRDIDNSGTALVHHLWKFYPDRTELPSIRDRLLSSSQEIYIFGLQLGQVVHDGLPLIEQRAREGYKVNLALLSPTDQAGSPISWINEMGSVHGFPNLDETLRANINRLATWHSGLRAAHGKNVGIRLYADIPTASVILVDPKKVDGYIHVEPILHGLDPSQRPSFCIRRSDSPGLYDGVRSRYLALWDSADPISRSKG